jgi:two-component system phosphate regulon sensor histidine kinase PhoR
MDDHVKIKGSEKETTEAAGPDAKAVSVFPPQKADISELKKGGKEKKAFRPGEVRPLADPYPQKFRKEDIDLFDISNEVFEEFGERIVANRVKVENMLKPGTVLTGNKTLVYTIIKNLVENSLKYAGSDITIHIECYSSIEKFCYLTYYDTGEGVPQEHLEQIFERFYRIEEGRTRDVGGSGLGLSIVKNAVKFHGGDIRAINRQWGGLQFFFSLRRQAD